VLAEGVLVTDQEITVLGKVATAFGIKGWIKVYSFTDPVSNILDYPIWLLNINGEWRKFEVEAGQTQSKGIVAKLQGIADRDAALALSQTEIAVYTSQLPEPDDDEFYWFQLEGLKVVNTQGQLLGKVKELFDSGGGNQVMKLTNCEGSIDQLQRLIPYVDTIVLDVDLETKVIQVEWEADY
jgi:16S rRNA processing protein RimM